ncbi:DUF4129 domain-containing protein [Calothrix sp. 336/3]|uniref:DUF4129 domain-containing protein n=1 Tax=Calothrix sp. 336/3 TaxID=1337936 RepID=UPI00062487EB|nr:DUF4129 domain-containing protein [Calothrix sp. 336/3]AKG24008.1 hypothetical protein IJ00_24265 [Calothrix sp. 336/3]
MSANSFEKSNWGWQISQVQRQVTEWFEYKFFRQNSPTPSSSTPEWSIPPWVESLFKLFCWLLLGLCIAWVLWQLWQGLSPYISDWWQGNSYESGVQKKASERELPVDAWLGRSQEYARQGNYHEACRCLYLAMLQRLHDTGILRHKYSRTDGEYLQLLQLSTTLVQAYETLITTHEQICFANHSMSADNYQQCQAAYQEITSVFISPIVDSNP